ncbi:MAG: FapA family protein [bacterium]
MSEADTPEDLDSADELDEVTEDGESDLGMDPGLDDEDLRSIEDELFDLEDELIEMQGTTIRTFEEEDERELEQVYTFNRPEDAQDDQSLGSEGSVSDQEALLNQLEEFRTSMQAGQEVKPGQLLAADLRGNNPQFEGGLYTVSSHSGERIYAGRVGQVSWSGDTVHVLPVKRIEGDVDSDTRDIRYDGSVFVEGSVRDNMTIEATGNIWVVDSLGRADLKAGGDIIVGRGIKGSEDHKIDAHGSVYAEFIENAVISAGENIITEEVIMHSNVEAGQGIYLLGEKGFLVGGEAKAVDRIYAQKIGSKNFPDTTIRLGSSGALQEELESLAAKRDKLESEETEYSKDVQNLLEKKDQGGLAPKDEERLRNFQFELNHIRQDLQEVKSRIKELEEEMDEERSREVIVEQEIFPNVVLKISNAQHEVEDEEVSHTVARIDDHEISFDSYSEPNFDFELTTQLDPDDADLEEKFDTPPLDQLRKHIIYREDKPLFDRERQLSRLMDLPSEHELVLIDITESDDEEDQEDSDSDEPSQDGSENEDDYDLHTWWGIEVREGESKDQIRLHYDAKRKNSVKVRCSSPEKGVQRAADYFGIDPDNIAVKVIEEGRQGVFGFGQKDFLIEAVRKEALQQDEEDSLEKDDLLAEAEEQEEVAGFINLDNSEEGLKLAVYPPEGHGMPVTVEQVEEELQEKDFTTDIDWNKVERIVEEAQGEQEIIGPRQRDPEVDGSFSITVNDDETEAYLTVYPPKPDGLPVKKNEVIEHLEDEGMNYDEEAVTTVFEEERFEEDVLIAEGSQPQDGEDGSIEFNVDLPPKEKADLTGREYEEPDETDDEEDQVDHRRGEEVISAKENQVLAELSPPTEGTPGVTVYGEEIPCEPGEGLDVQVGENVRRSGDQTQLIAETDGRVLVKKGKLALEPVFIVNGDLDYETGNVEFDGVVVVKGRILDGFKVEATERVEAEAAGKCQIISEGDVYLKKGMAGKEEGRIQAKGDVFVKYLENTSVKCGGSVVVEQTIMHSEVDAADYVIADSGRKGAILGGLVRAGEAISIKKLGSGMAPKTEVEVGIEPKVRDRVRELEDEIESQKSKFEKVRLGLQGLNQKIDEVGGKEYLPEEKQEKHTRLSNVAGAIKHKLEGLHGELEDLRNEIQSSEGGTLYVEEDVFSGAKITVQTATLHVTNPDNHIRCILENGEVVRRPYEDPEIDIEEPETVL